MLIRFIGGLVTTISLFIILFIIFSNLSQSKAEQFTASNENCSQVAPIRRLSQQFPAHSLVLLFCDPFTSDRLQQQSSPAAHSVHIQNIRQLQTLLHKLKQEEIIRNTLYREQQFYSPSGWYHQPQRCTRLHHPHQHLHHACIHQQHVHVSDPSGYTTPMTTSTPTNCAGSYKLPLFGAQKQCLALLDFATADQGLFSCVHDLQTDQSKVWNDWLWWTKQLALSGISSLKSHLPFYNDLAPDDPQPLPLHRTLAPPTLSGQLLHLTCRLTWPFDSRCAFANQFVVRLPKNVRNRTDLMNSIYDGSNGASPSIGVWHRRHLARLISQISSYCALWQNGRPIGYQWVSASRVPSFDSSSDASQSSDSIALILWSWGWMAIVALVLISAFFFTILIVSLKSTPDWPVFVDSDAEEETYAKYSDSLRTKSSNQSVQDQVKRLKRRQQNIEKSHNDRAHQKFDHQTIHVSGESAHPIQTISVRFQRLIFSIY